ATAWAASAPPTRPSSASWPAPSSQRTGGRSGPRIRSRSRRQVPLALPAGPLYGSCMELEVGPFDPALHIRSRDHYEAVRREAQLLAQDPEAPSARLDDLIDRLSGRFPPSPVDDVAERAY